MTSATADSARGGVGGSPLSPRSVERVTHAARAWRPTPEFRRRAIAMMLERQGKRHRMMAGLPWWKHAISALNLALLILSVVAIAYLASTFNGQVPRCALALDGLVSVALVALTTHLLITYWLVREWPPLPPAYTPQWLLHFAGYSALGSEQSGSDASEIVPSAFRFAPSETIDSAYFQETDEPIGPVERCRNYCSYEKMLQATAATLCLLTVGALFIAFGVGLWVASSTSVARTGTFSLPGVHAPITINRDANGVMHISAVDLHDASFAHGVVHAQERLWQMEFQRRVGQGRLSELVGSAGVDTDILMRTLGMYTAAQASYDRLGSQAKIAIDAYVDGVNAYLSSSRAPRPLEFLLFGARPAPWRAADSLVWAKLMSYDLSGNLDREVSRWVRGLILDQSVTQPVRIYMAYGINWSAFGARKTHYSSLFIFLIM